MPDQILGVSPVSALINKIREIITRFIASKPPFLRWLGCCFLVSSVPNILLSQAASCKLLSFSNFVTFWKWVVNNLREDQFIGEPACILRLFEFWFKKNKLLNREGLDTMTVPLI